MRQSAMIKSRTEDLAREHRFEVEKLRALRRPENELPKMGSYEDVKFRNFSTSKVHRFGFKAPWYRAVNWDVAFSWFCGIVLGFCGWYTIFFVVRPLLWKLISGGD